MKIKIAGALVALAATTSVFAAPVYPTFQDPNYGFEIYSLSSEGYVGQTFTSGGQLVRSNGGGGVYVHSLAADTTVHGTNTIHSATFSSISGYSGGYGLTTGMDGTIYANTGSGVQVINLATNTATTVAITAAHGGAYGIKTMADGRIAHSTSSQIYIYDPVLGTDTLIYNAPTFIDDIATDTLGNIFLAGLGNSTTIIINSMGTVLNTIASSHNNDGMAYGNGSIYKNNTDGTVTRLDFTDSTYSTLVSEVLIASGGGYGDLASVGPDGSFYVTNQNLMFADGTYTGGYVLARISCNSGPCFAGGGIPDPTSVPEPATLLLTGVGMLGMALSRRRRAA